MALGIFFFAYIQSLLLYLMLCEFAVAVFFFLPKRLLRMQRLQLNSWEFSSLPRRRRRPRVRRRGWSANLIKKVQARDFFKFSVGECSTSGDKGVYLFARQIIFRPKDGRSHSFARSFVSSRSFTLSVIGISRLENS